MHYKQYEHIMRFNVLVSTSLFECGYNANEQLA